MVRISNRSDVPAFQVMDILAEAIARREAGESVLFMIAGEPSAGTPKEALAAAGRALERPIGYTETPGWKPLRERIAAYYSDYYGVDVPVERVIVTSGSSGGFTLAFLGCFDVGQKVAFGIPGYAAYTGIIKGLGLQPVHLRTSAANRFQPTVKDVEKALADHGPIEGLLLCSPANPTGTMIHAEELKALVDCCAANNIQLISDEIYHRITFEQKAATALSFTGDAVIINSFSKYYCMTGWRLGWMVVPQALIRRTEVLAQNYFISPGTVAQKAGLAAFDCVDELDGNVQQYRKNRDVLLTALNKAGLQPPAPAEGAFYVYVDMGAYTNDAQAFCKKMLAETGVVAVSGEDFDPENGRRFVRFSIAGETSNVAEAADRLSEWLPRQAATCV